MTSQNTRLIRSPALTPDKEGLTLTQILAPNANADDGITWKTGFECVREQAEPCLSSEAYRYV